jgi:hypothetical protein
MLKFTLKWFSANKIYTATLLIILSVVGYLCFTLSQYFYFSSMKESIDGVKNNEQIYFADFSTPISAKEFEKILSEELKSNLVTINLATDTGDSNNFKYSTDLLNENIVKMWGHSPKNDNEVMQFTNSYSYGNINLFGKDFLISGYGSIYGCSADYKITFNTYKKYVNEISHVQFDFDTAPSNEQVTYLSNELSNLSGENIALYEYEGFNESGFNSVKNTLIIAVILILIALISAVFFMNMLIELQKKDIYVMILCGARKERLIFTFLTSVTIFSLIALAIGAVLFSVVSYFDFFLYSRFFAVNPIVYSVLMFVLPLEIAAYIILRKNINRLYQFR